MMDTKLMSMQGTPPTEQDLADRRCAAEAMLAQCAKNDRSFRTTAFGAILTALTALAVLVFTRQIDFKPLEISTLIALVSATMIFVMVVGLAGVGAWHLAGGLLPGLVAAGLLFAGMLPGGVAAAIAIGGAGAAAGYLYDRWVVTPRTTATAVLHDLVYLDYSSHPDECIAFVGFVEADDAVRAYQHQLVALGRKPVLGEYRAAKDWMDQKETRLAKQEKLELARQAYSQLGAAI